MKLRTLYEEAEWSKEDLAIFYDLIRSGMTLTDIAYQSGINYNSLRQLLSAKRKTGQLPPDIDDQIERNRRSTAALGGKHERTPEELAKASQSIRDRWADPEFRPDVRRINLDQVLSMINDGRTTADIARTLGHKRERIIDKLKRHGLYTDELRDKIIQNGLAVTGKHERTPEAIAKLKQSLRSKWADPKFRPDVKRFNLDQVLGMIDRGLTTRAISISTGVKWKSIKSKLRRYGLYTDELRDKIVQNGIKAVEAMNAAMRRNKSDL